MLEDPEKAKQFLDIVESLRKCRRTKIQIANQLQLRGRKGEASGARLEQLYGTAIRYLAYCSVLKWKWGPGEREKFENSFRLAVEIEGMKRKEALELTEAYEYTRQNYEEAVKLLELDRYLNDYRDVYTVWKIV